MQILAESPALGMRAMSVLRSMAIRPRTTSKDASLPMPEELFAFSTHDSARVSQQDVSSSSSHEQHSPPRSAMLARVLLQMKDR